MGWAGRVLRRPAWLAWGSPALRGAHRPRLARAWVGALPVRRSCAPRVFASVGCRRSVGPAEAGPPSRRRPPWAWRPLPSRPRGPRAVRPAERRGHRCPWSPPHENDASSPGLRGPYDTVSGWRIRQSIGGPPPIACRVRGLATSFATCTTIPTGARGAGASMGFSLQGVPLVVIGASLEAPAFVTFAPLHVPPIKRAADGHAAPAGSPSRLRSHDESVLRPRQSARAVDALLGFCPPEHAPLRSGAGFRRGRLPSRPRAGSR